MNYPVSCTYRPPDYVAPYEELVPKLVPYFGEDVVLLDIECGMGILALPISKHVKNVIGIDQDEGILAYIYV